MNRSNIYISILAGILSCTVYLSTAIAKDKPNGGKAEAVGKTIGAVTGAAIGGAAGVIVGGAGGSVGMGAGLAAGSTAARLAGAAAGAAAGKSLDIDAERNAKSGRGGIDDPRYNPCGGSCHQKNIE